MIDTTAAYTVRPIPEPETRLDPRAKRIWVIEELLVWGILVPVVGAVAFGVRTIFDVGWTWPAIAFGIALALALLSIFLTPGFRYRQWRYAIREREIDLRFGLFTHTRQLVPISRVQHVDTRRGPLMQRFGLASVVFYTAAGSIEIPALAVETANDVRDRIAALANVQDDL